MSDGSSLRQSWYKALNDAEAHFHALLTSSSTNEWKRVSTTGTGETSTSRKGKGRLLSSPELSDVVVHRKQGEDIYRLILEVPAPDDSVTLEPWETVFSAPELRKEWDPAVVDAHLVETLDHTTRICKTNFTLGWPANPRDAVTISRSFRDSTTFIDVSTSVPRSPEEPVYLRPSPPYVRSNVTLFAWCIQHIPQGKRLRITCFWQHDLRSVWNIGSSSGIVQQLATMVLGLFKTVLKRGARTPKLIGYGNGVTIERVRFQMDREALTVDYAIIPEDDEHEHVPSFPDYAKAVDAQQPRREPRTLELVLPASAGWDVQVSLKGSSPEVEKLPWQARAMKRSSYPSGQPHDQILLRLSHVPLLDEHSILKVRLILELSGPSSGLRMNGIPHAIADVEERSPTTYAPPILPDFPSTASLSFNTSASSIKTAASSIASNNVIARPHTERTPAAEKSILSRVKRNYIYFSSLLQEPEAKWKRTTEARGVTITQLDSIDPTLVVYRAEATFVGVGLWDLYGAISTPGAKNYWDKQHEDAVLLEDVNDLTELWHLKTKPAWPVNGRDSVVLKTVYKSPSTIHVFAFSADDPHLFPTIPAAEPNVIRTQVDLQGWAIEALSPTTTQVTLLEQSDPKGWTNKTSIPTQMIGALAGIGEFTIKCGGPPVMTRLAGAKANEIRYEHERMNFRVEYEVSSARNGASETAGDSANNSSMASASMPIVECELRCDVDTWAASLDIVIDPPPQSISALRRHKLSGEGGGLWLTIIHDAVFVDDERLLVIVRRGPGKEKGLVMVNGAKVQVDVEELPEHEIKSLAKRKRVKPTRIPLDQPPVVGVIRRRRAEWDSGGGDDAAKDKEEGPSIALSSGWASAPKISSPLSRFFTFGNDSLPTPTQSAITPAELAPSSSKSPMQYALDALAWVQETHLSLESDAQDWVSVSEKGIPVKRKSCPDISPSIPVHQSEKIIEGVSAEELAPLIMDRDCRLKWDERFDGATPLQSFGAECQTTFSVAKAQFPFRDRGFHLAGIIAKTHVAPLLSRRSTGDASELGSPSKNATYYVQASFSPDSVSDFQSASYNPYTLPVGRVFVDAWVLETLDPYTTENYAIPSSRCTRLVAVDYAGSIPTAMNSMFNATLARSPLGLEAFVKGMVPIPITRLPPPGLLLNDRKADHPVLDVHWRLRRRDEVRTLVATRYSQDTMRYKSTILVGPTVAGEAMRSPTRSVDLQTTPKFSRTPTSHSTEGLPPSISETLASSSSSNISGLPPSSSDSPLLSPNSTPPIRHKSSGASLSPPPGDGTLRGRSSSAFTLKGEPRQISDLLVAELVVDAKLYPEGYTVVLSSRTRTNPSVIDLASEPRSACILPLIYTIHTIPLSPLHSSGMNTGSPTRHLVRLTLPTAQYEVSTVLDPLTGEMQSAPPKPPWLMEMEESGSVVDVEVRPGKGVNVQIGEEVKEVAVVGEKESLTALGREELSDDRLTRMGVLSRSTNEIEVIPSELTTPVGVNLSLLDPSSPLLPKQLEEASETKVEEENKEVAVVQRPVSETTSAPPTPPTPARGFLQFFQSYQNPLSRFSGNVVPGVALPPTPAQVDKAQALTRPKPLPQLRIPSLASVASAQARQTSTMYPISTVLITALIAFLLGSLMRSLLSPADFIYVVTDLREAEEANSISGWREIRRLFEIKYVLGGWDFQVAVVRRH